MYSLCMCRSAGSSNVILPLIQGIESPIDRTTACASREDKPNSKTITCPNVASEGGATSSQLSELS